jgi:hypothetical protein
LVDGFGDDVSVAVLVACVITWFRMGDVLPALFGSPTYTAVSGYESAFRSDLVRVATPLALSVAEPRENTLQLKNTLPVGVTEPEVVTVAVQVTF